MGMAREAPSSSRRTCSFTSSLVLIICLLAVTLTLQGIAAEGPSESECRPLIEKALKERLEGAGSDTIGGTDSNESANGQDESTEVTSDSGDKNVESTETQEDGDATESGTDKDDSFEEQAQADAPTPQGDSAEVTKENDSTEEQTPEESETDTEEDTQKSDEGKASDEDGASIESKKETESEDVTSAEAGAGSIEGKTSTEENTEESATSAEAADEEQDTTKSEEETDTTKEDLEKSTETTEESSKDTEDVSKEDGEDEASTGDDTKEHDAASTEDRVPSAEGVESAEKDATSAEEGAESAEEATESAEKEATSAEEGAESGEEGAASVEEGAASAEEGAESGEEGAVSVEEGAVSAEENASAEEGEASTEEGTASIEKRSASVEEDAASVEEGAASAEEGTESIEEGAVSVEDAASVEGALPSEGAASAEAGTVSVEGAESAEGVESVEGAESAEGAESLEEGAASTEGAPSTKEEEISTEKETAEEESKEEQKDADTVEEESKEADTENVTSVETGTESSEGAASIEELAEKSVEDTTEEEKDETAEDETETEEVDETPEAELTQETLIPENLRPRDHLSELLHLDDESAETEVALAKAADVTLRELKRIYDTAIKPLEILYKYRDLSNRHFGDPEIFSKPLILFMGPWSGGKSSIINYLLDNEYNDTSLRTGAEPSPAYFNILMWGAEPEILDGTQLAADWTFSGLQKFGQGLEDRLRGLKLPNKLLEKVNIVEIPGILEVRKVVSRMFPFNDACQWFIDRADIIFLVYDPSKLDVGPETEAILDQLKGREYQTRIILNKADTVKPEELMRVQSALIWNISPLMSSPQPPVMYTTSLWSTPFTTGAPIRLLQAQERAFLRDLRQAVDKRVENKISSARRFAVRVRNHAKMVDCYLTTYYNHKSLFGNRKQIADEIIENPQQFHIYEGLSTLTNISRYDLPDPDVYKDFFRLNALYDFQPLSATCTYFRGCPINRLDVAIAYDLPELVGKHKKLVESATGKPISNS